MNNIIEFGKQGVEQLSTQQEVDGMPIAEGSIEHASPIIEIIKRFPSVSFDADLASEKRSVALKPLALSNDKVFDLARNFAVFSPIVYARKNNTTVMGMMSPNYDNHGRNLQPDIKILPLRRPMPLELKGQNDFRPNADMAVMLSGMANAESRGVGSHDGTVSADFEHRLTMLGAVSLGTPSVALEHKNHAVRQSSSVATGLSNGSLGNMYRAGEGATGFDGFAPPVTFTKGAVQKTDAIYIPESFLETSEAFAGHYTDAAQVVMGYGYRVLGERSRPSDVASQISRLGDQIDNAGH